MARLSVTLLALGLLSLPLRAQAPLSIEVFADAETWTELPPGKLGTALDRLQNLRITMDAVFGAAGLTSTMHVDVTGVKFQARPAVWIQYLSTGTDNSPTNGTVALDAIAIDRATARALFRIQSAPPPAGTRQAWAGPYDLIQYGPDSLVRTRVAENGTSDLIRKDIPPVAEFATLGFVLPGLDLAEGRHFRIPGYTPGADRTASMPLHVAGRVPFLDATEKTHEVWAVDLLTQNRTTVIRLYVSESAPYFYGWVYRRVADGVPVIRFTLRSWQRLD